VLLFEAMSGNTLQPTLIRRAPAKLNLALSVGGPAPAGSARPGFHPIASWMACTALFDEVRLTALERHEQARYEVKWADDAPRTSTIDWPIAQDLAVRAHKLLEAHIAKPLPVHMTVLKRIPIGAGLGGGSSDAAAALLATVHAWKLAVSPATLMALAGSIGSDVPFFLDLDSKGLPRDQHPGPALVSGFGDVIERIPRVAAEVLLVFPPFGCPTAGVYGAYDRILAGQHSAHASIPAASRPTCEANEGLVRLLIRRAVEARSIDSSSCFNALTAPAVHLEPRVAAVIEAVTQICGQQAHLTGSGSCVFLIGDHAAIDRAQERLRAAISTVVSLEGSSMHRGSLV
jgi:4-diphosphocytidyl-2-C-methyl-D-erythritol kinase